jgi:tetratricopeptide (TPR) repeat protein
MAVSPGENYPDAHPGQSLAILDTAALGKQPGQENQRGKSPACPLWLHICTKDHPAALPNDVAEKAAAGAKTSSRLNTLGAALYRAGKFNAAVQRLNKAIKEEGKGGTAWDWLFLAMAHHRLGHAAEAKQWLAKAVQWIEKASNPKPDKAAGTPLPWDQRLELKVLRREAEELILGKAAVPKK